MSIDAKDLLSVKEALQEAGLPLKEGQFETIVTALNRLLELSDEMNKQREAEMGPEAYARMMATINQATARIGKDFTEKLQKLLDSAERNDKL